METTLAFKKQMLLILFCLVNSKTIAQTLSSPYSIYGIGDIETRSYNRTSGMANTGLAKSSSHFLVDNNPASLVGLERSVLLVDIAFDGKFVNFSGTPINQYNSKSRELFSVKRFSVSEKINSYWATSIGFRNFSNVSYGFRGTKQVDGLAELSDVNYDGSGGLNDFYWSNAIKLNKNFTIGVKSSLIAGSIYKTETIYDDNISSIIETSQQDYFSKLKFEGGLIYTADINKKWNLSLANKFSFKTGLNYERRINVLENDNTIINDKFIKKDKFFLPNAFAFGLQLKNKKAFSLLVDYSFENWAALKVKQLGYSYTDKHRLSIGAEIAKMSDSYWVKNSEKKYYQFGAFVGNSYINVKGNQINEFGVSAGKGGYLNKNLLYALALEAGSRGTINTNLIKENYFRFSIALSYRTFLNSKGYKYF
jgi:hypothetical protein